MLSHEVEAEMLEMRIQVNIHNRLSSHFLSFQICILYGKLLHAG